MEQHQLLQIITLLLATLDQTSLFMVLCKLLGANFCDSILTFFRNNLADVVGSIHHQVQCSCYCLQKVHSSIYCRSTLLIFTCIFIYVALCAD